MKKKKKKLEGKQEYEFFRWGILTARNHPEAALPENCEERSYHTAPVKKGIYAFPKGYIETFLLGLSDSRKNPDGNNNGRRYWIRNENREILTLKDVYINPYNKIEGIKPEIKGFLKKKGIKSKDLDYIFTGDIENDEDWENPKNFKMTYNTKVHRFKYSGPYIWHHLDSYNDKGTDKNIIKPEDIIDRKGSWVKTTMKVWIKALNKIDTIFRWQSYIDSVVGNRKGAGNPHTYPFRYSKDMFEVFIEKLK